MNYNAIIMNILKFKSKSFVSMKLQKEKIIIILTVFIDVLGIGIIIPVLPYYVENFGVSAFGTTLLFAVFSLCSFFSSPLLGALSDRYGRRPMLIISIASSALGWFVFAGAQNKIMLFVGRIIDGMAAGNFPIAQSYLVDIARNDKERTSNLGIIGAVFGLGFIIGPAIGAALSSVDQALPFWTVGILATINTIGAIFFLPETNKDIKKEVAVNFHPFAPLKRAFEDKMLHSRYLTWFIFGFAIAIIQTVFALYARDEFGYDSMQTGFLFTAMGVGMVINQGFLLRKFWLKKFKENWLETWLFLPLALAFAFMGGGFLWSLFLGMFINVLVQSVIHVVIPSRVSGIAGHLRRGEVLGIMSSIISVSMIFGPIAAGALFEIHRQWPFFLAAVSLTGAFIVMRWYSRIFPQEVCQKNDLQDVVTL